MVLKSQFGRKSASNWQSQEAHKVQAKYRGNEKNFKLAAVTSTSKAGTPWFPACTIAL